MARLYTNAAGLDVIVSSKVEADMRARGEWGNLHIRQTKCEGSGPRDRVAIAFEINGLGDAIHAMPALSQKIADGFRLTVYCGSFLRPIFESLGCSCPDSVYHDGRLVVDASGFGTVYMLEMWATEHPADCGAEMPTLTQFEQVAKLIETSLPESFDFRRYLVRSSVQSTNATILALHSSGETNGDGRNLWRSYSQEAHLINRLNERIDIVGSSDRGTWSSNIHALIDRIDAATGVIATDSGVLAIALALGKPTVAIMGPTDEQTIVRQFSRYVENRQVNVVRSLLNDSCARPCNFQYARGFEVAGKCSGGRADCIEEIAPSDIVAAYRDLFD